MSVKSFSSAPSSESCRLISFDKYEVLESNPPVLVVSGTAPCANMEVSLQPAVYIACPEYWRIEVVGCLPGGICLTALKPFRITISLGGIIGSEGMEIAGSNKVEQVKVAGGCSSSFQPDQAPA